MHSVGAGKFWGVRRIFARMSPNLPKKHFVWLLPTNVLQQRSWRPFLEWPRKKGFYVLFCKSWTPLFARFSGVLLGFSEILPKFWRIFPRLPTNQNFSLCASPCTPASYPIRCAGQVDNSKNKRRTLFTVFQRQATASKTLLNILNTVLKVIITIVNFIKASPVISRRFSTTYLWEVGFSLDVMTYAARFLALVVASRC